MSKVLEVLAANRGSDEVKESDIKPERMAYVEGRRWRGMVEG